ncbi:YdcF family protein [Motiliproteus sediminis]|uniref:YdcF family protein n=1 Tax=Motiliproteus sediminis TaxID=1468178 RepID=UPI001AEF814F|nr:YdcF family protein [Motiliproteus sediminis]
MDSLFFLSSKLIWAFARPDHLLLLLLTVAAVRGRWRHAGIGNDRRQSHKLLWFTLVLLWLIALYPAGNLLLYPLETRFKQQPVVAEELSGVVVLGGGESLARSRYWDRLELTDAGDRYLELLALAQQFPDLPIIFTGGSGAVTQQQFGGADALEPLLQRLGLAQRVILERKSRNTYENALFAKPLADPISAERGDKPWLLVTSAFHMPRSVGIFQAQGWSVQPHPVDHWSLPPAKQRWYFSLSENLVDLTMGVREWLGLFAYRLTGKTHQLLPGSAGAGVPEPQGK